MAQHHQNIKIEMIAICNKYVGGCIMLLDVLYGMDEQPDLYYSKQGKYKQLKAGEQENIVIKKQHEIKQHNFLYIFLF